MKILIVDDIASQRKLLRAQLEDRECELAEAADGVEALAVLARERFDAVISDILMPRMDGYRLCHEIRMDPALRELRFVLYSSTYTSPGDVKLSRTVGADRFLVKPARTDEICAAVLLNGAVPRAQPGGVPAEAYVLREYSTVLVAKLAEKNTDLVSALASLQRAHEQIVELNAGLEARVAQRTAELVAANHELTAALAEVKQLSALLPICSYCRCIRDGKDYWDCVEGYIERHTNSRFSHSVCPACYQKHVVPMLATLESPAPSEGTAPAP